jgi:uncharacterized protein YukE
MGELGETADPRLLVPGDPEAARATARSMVAFAGNLTQAGESLERLNTPEGWSGEGADAFRGRFAVLPSAWQDAGDAFTVASRALDVYAETLEQAQRQAAEAVRVFSEAQVASEQDVASPPVDAGGVRRAQAQGLLDRVRAELAAAGDDAARALDEAAAGAPTSPSFWEDLVDVLGDVGREGINAAASLGNAALHHVPEVAAMLGGAGLMVVGGTGALGGGALTVTGAGAPAGVPLTIASAGLVATGAGIAGAGAISLAINAFGDDRVQPLGDGGDTPVFPQRPSAQRPAVQNAGLNNIVRPLYRGANSPTRTGDGTTADAVRAERLTGQPVKDKPHTRKANEAVRALRNWLRRHRDASPEDRGIATNELNNLLNALGRS